MLLHLVLHCNLLMQSDMFFDVLFRSFIQPAHKIFPQTIEMSAVTTSIPIPLGERVRIAPTSVAFSEDKKINYYQEEVNISLVFLRSVPKCLENEANQTRD